MRVRDPEGSRTARRRVTVTLVDPEVFGFTLQILEATTGERPTPLIGTAGTMGLSACTPAGYGV
jgi:hypothetical protein